MKPRIPFHFHLITLFILIFTFTFILASCNPSEPEDNKQLTLTVEDASSTEVWVGLKTNSFSLPVSGMIKINSLAKKAVTISSSDTVIYIDSLSPNTAYKLQAELSGISSSEVTVTTMDTTSHNFTWQTYTFGGVNGSSVLNDVAIINENDIWAVGEIHTTETDQFDSNGVWVDPYNAVHWDGNSWELKRIANSSYRRTTVFAFASNDVWFDGTIHWDGIQYTVKNNGFPLDSNGYGWRINSMWGTSSSDFYVVGDGGNIAHYNGSPSADGWRKIESGTELNIQDVWGSIDRNTGEEEILCIASNKYFKEGNKLLQIKGDEVVELSNNGLPWSLSSIWFIQDRKYYISGDGIFEKSILSENKWRNDPLDITSYYSHGIKGTSFNNIGAVGGAGEVLHFNGKNWKSFYNNTQLGYGNYYSLDIKGNTIVAVGQDSPRAVITIGKN